MWPVEQVRMTGFVLCDVVSGILDEKRGKDGDEALVTQTLPDVQAE